MHVCVSCDQFVDVESSRCPKCSTRLLSLDAFRMPDLAIPRDGRSLLDMRIGTVLGGEWVVDGALGEGGDGVVYRVHNRANGQAAAAKRQRGAGEVQVDGPHVLAQIGSAAAADGRRFTLFEHCPSGSLRDVLDRLYASGQQPAVAQVIETLRQITRGLMAYHRCGVVHGDLKPDNLLVAQAGGGRGHLKLGDPLAPEDLGKSRGSPPYAAPEVCDGAQVTPKADLWALGVIGYELVTGHLPFEALGRDGVVRQVVSDQVSPPPLPRTTRRRLARLLRSLLSKDPALRPGSPEEVLGILDRVDADPEEWQRLGSIAIAAIGSLMLIAALAFGGRSAPVVAKPSIPKIPLTESLASGGSNEKAKPVQPAVEPPKESTPEKSPAPLPEKPLPAPVLDFEVNCSVAGGRVIEWDNVFYVPADKNLEIEFKQIGKSYRIVPSVSLDEGRSWREGNDGDAPKVLIDAKDLGPPGQIMSLQCRCRIKSEKEGREREPKSIKVMVYSTKPGARVTKENLEPDARGFTHWRVERDKDKQLITDPLHPRSYWKEWDLPKIEFFIGDESVAKCQATWSDDLEVEGLDSVEKEVGKKGQVEFRCISDCKIELLHGSQSLELEPLPGKDRTLYTVDLASSLKKVMSAGDTKFQIRVSARDRLPRTSKEFTLDPSGLFKDDEIRLEVESARYRLGSGQGGQQELQLVVPVKLPRLLGLNLKTEGTGWDWDSEALELSRPVPAKEWSLSRPKLDREIGVTFGGRSFKNLQPLPEGVGTAPFEALLGLLSGGRVASERQVTLRSLKEAEFFKTLFRELVYDNQSWTDFPEWGVSVEVGHQSGREVALQLIGYSQVEECKKWLQLPVNRGALVNEDDYAKIKKTGSEYFMSGQLGMGEDAADVVDIIRGYVAWLNWASKQLGQAAKFEPATMSDYLILGEAERLRSLETSSSKGWALVFPISSITKDRPSTELPSPLEFLKDSDWGAWSQAKRSNSQCILYWTGQEWEWPLKQRLPLRFLVTLVQPR